METPLPIPEAQPPAPKEPTMSLAARLLNVFAVPGDVFESVKSAPASTSNWLVPTLLLAVVGVASALLIGSQDTIKQQKLELQDRVFQKMVESGKMTKEQADRASQSAQAGGSLKNVLGAVAVPFLTLLSLFWWALLIWLGGSIIMRGGFGYMRAAEVVGLASMIGVLGVVVRTLLVVVMGNMFAGPTPAVFIKDFDSFNTWHGILAGIDLFGLWALGVQASGMAKLSGVSYGKAAAWVFGMWMVFTVVLIGIGLAVRKLMGF